MSPICTPRHHKAKLETPAISHRDWIPRSALLWSQEPSSPQHNFSKAKGLLVYTLLCSLGIASFPEVAAACKRFAKSIALKMSIVFPVVFRKLLPTSCRCASRPSPAVPTVTLLGIPCKLSTPDRTWPNKKRKASKNNKTKQTNKQNLQRARSHKSYSSSGQTGSEVFPLAMSASKCWPNPLHFGGSEGPSPQGTTSGDSRRATMPLPVSPFPRTEARKVSARPLPISPLIRQWWAGPKTSPGPGVAAPVRTAPNATKNGKRKNEKNEKEKPTTRRWVRRWRCCLPLTGSNNPLSTYSNSSSPLFADRGIAFSSRAPAR